MMIEKMVEEISKTGLYIISDLDNWNITEGGISKIGGGGQGKKEHAAKKSSSGQGGGQKAA